MGNLGFFHYARKSPKCFRNSSISFQFGAGIQKSCKQGQKLPSCLFFCPLNCQSYFPITLSSARWFFQNFHTVAVFVMLPSREYELIKKKKRSPLRMPQDHLQNRGSHTQRVTVTLNYLLLIFLVNSGSIYM